MSSRDYYQVNAERIKARMRSYYRDHTDEIKERVREYGLIKRYGLTVAEYHALLSAQDECCGACGEKFPMDAKINVDHNHTTGRVRGLLCNRCNIALGYLENEVLVAQLFAYKERCDGR